MYLKLFILQGDLISPSCVVASQEQCLRKQEAKRIPHSILFRYAFLSMVGNCLTNSSGRFRLLVVLLRSDNSSVAALNLIFSFTNGKEWDGPYRLQFQVPKAWQNKPISFFNEVTMP